MKILSLNETSILRKFLIFFLLVSIIPLGVLFYIYFQIEHYHEVRLSPDDITTVLLWVILGITCGYWTMRKTIIGFIETAKEGQRAIASSLTHLQSSANTLEENETAQLDQTFRAITAKLETDRQNLESAKKTLHSVLTKISVGLASNQNINGLLHLIVETATEALGGKIGLALLLNRGSSSLVIRTTVGDEGINVQKLQFSSEDSTFSSVIKNKKSVMISSLNEIKDASRASMEHLTFPIICAPLLVNDIALGVLVVSGKRTPGNFNEDDLSLLYNMALQAAVALNNDELKSLANTDSLTGIFNYRHMVAVLDYETMRLKRYPGNLSMIIFDVDEFKPYNDEFGHPEGDTLLTTLSQSISKKLRNSDVFCRYGGDEFAVIMPQTALPGALIVANQIKESADALQLKRKITLSIGGAEWIHPMSRHELLVKADKALYRAKGQGKDKILFIND